MKPYKRLFALAFLLLSLPSFAGTTTLTGIINDAQGVGLNGWLVMQLPYPAQDPTTNSAIQPTPVYFKVLAGNIVSGSGVPQLFDVATIQPSGLYYIAKAYDPAGNLVFNGNYVVTGASFNIGTATPTSVTTSNVSYILPIFPNQTNSFTATQQFSAITSLSSPVAATGWVRSAATDTMCWRNVGNTTDLCLGPTVNVSSTDYLSVPKLSVAGTPLPYSLGVTTVASITVQTSAGSGASAGCSSFGACKDNGGQIVITTGTGPSVGTLAVIAFGGTHNGASCTLWPYQEPAGTLSGATQVLVSPNSTQFAISSGPSALAASTPYGWNYTCTFN